MQVVGCDACAMEDAGQECLDTYETLMRAHGGEDSQVFVALVVPVLERVARQQAEAPLAAGGAAVLAAGLWTALAAEGWLPRGGAVVAGSRIDGVVTAALAGVSGVAVDSIWGNAARQLVKALTYPELTECRLSYAEVDAKGVCRRQALAVARARVSGSHCVDCPYWTALRADHHRELLAARWRGASGAALAEASDVFLPEDFRQLRHWWWAARRQGGRSALG